MPVYPGAFEPSPWFPPTVNGGFVGCDGQGGISSYDRLDAFAAITFVRDENIRKFVMYPLTIIATEPANDKYYLLSKTIYVFALPAADDFQRPVTAGAGNLLRALYKKHVFQGFQLAHILIQ